MLRIILPALFYAMTIAFGCAVQAQPWPAGKEKLPWLEGRWSSGDCRTSYTEYRFAGSGKRDLSFNFGPANGDKKLKVDVYYDEEGKIVLYFPSLSFRTIVVFQNRDLRNTTDIDKNGKVGTGAYRRCSA